jgi:hypothetical protein
MSYSSDTPCSSHFIQIAHEMLRNWVEQSNPFRLHSTQSQSIILILYLIEIIASANQRFFTSFLTELVAITNSTHNGDFLGDSLDARNVDPGSRLLKPPSPTQLLLRKSSIPNLNEL